jgi:hypothetical protein
MEPDFSQTDFQKYSGIKIRQVGVKLFHADGQTDVTNLIIAFRNFANATKNR